MNQSRKKNLKSMANVAINNHKHLYDETISETSVMELALRQYIKQQEKQYKKIYA
ncbi:hypothetical protein [Lysinibacillus irui]|uniref:Uncharacterized protein n=1 Tax=Lysinibacillus irui TaxID=2998077 RepID=A0AAJ5UTI4_9BACI|nr:hypothetical protein [Lysinibacillus irui]WDV07134.1 hypothetical protein OU989_01260 [Lysinibacillus irui]